MLNRTIRARLIVLSSLSLLAFGLVVSGTDGRASGAPPQTSATAPVHLLPNGGVFGWD